MPTDINIQVTARVQDLISSTSGRVAEGRVRTNGSKTGKIWDQSQELTRYLALVFTFQTPTFFMMLEFVAVVPLVEMPT